MITKLFIIVLARDRKHVDDKIRELENLGVPYRIICGERLNHPNVVYRAPKGKYDAINFGASLIPKDVDIVVMNDVDTVIHNFHLALRHLKDEKVALAFGTEMVKEGPQNLFFRFLNPIRRKIPVAASGELMFIRRDVLERILPLKPCKAEDTYILFRVLECGYKTIFCEGCYAETERTKSAEKEEIYKRKTVTGIYQALTYTQPPYLVKLFYVFLPIACPLLLVLGKKGYFWMRGILLGLIDFLRGDRTGVWQPTYME
jgi:cellulose synthase/poly-beta-1,6-N-acetylglucosamine synthase-like glycosyltransferase